jgi:predicted dehydrogenase
MPETDSLGIGFVGAGFITETFHADTLRGIRNAHAAGIYNPTREKAERVADSLREADCGDPSVADSVVDLTRDPDVDALWITSPNYVRVETVGDVVETVESGADLTGIAIEKPLARTVAEAREVIDLVESTDLAHAYLENQVYMPGVEKVRSLLWDGADATGRPYLARAAEEHAGPHSAWFWDGEKQGGGVLSDMMCHSHKVNKHLLERPGGGGGGDGNGLTPLAVTCDISTLKWTRGEYADRLADEFDVDYRSAPAEDYARATVYYETDDGEVVVGEATTSWCFVGSGLRLTVELLGPEYSGNINTLDSGTDVFFSSDVDDESGYVVEKQQAGQGQMPVVPDEVTTYGYLAQNRHVVDAFRDGENASEDLRDGLEVVELCMASYMAAERGERVVFDEVDLADYVPEPARGDFDPSPEGLTGENQ